MPYELREDREGKACVFGWWDCEEGGEPGGCCGEAGVEGFEVVELVGS